MTVCGCCNECGESAGHMESPLPPANPHRDVGLQGWLQGAGRTESCTLPPSAELELDQAFLLLPLLVRAHLYNLTHKAVMKNCSWLFTWIQMESCHGK